MKPVSQKSGVEGRKEKEYCEEFSTTVALCQFSRYSRALQTEVA